MYIIHPHCEKILEEKNFDLFKHEGLFCVVSRMPRTGCLNGYVSVPEGHTLYGVEYNGEVVVPDIKDVKFNGNYIGLLCTDAAKAEANIISMDMVINVHYGLTFSRDCLYNIEKDLLGKLWWFGFDTAHSSDLQPIEDERFSHFDRSGNTYKDFDFVLSETKSLAEQLSKF
jgi:hypothetical protein